MALSLQNASVARQFGAFGAEFAAQLRWSEQHPRWDQLDPENQVSLEQLGVRDRLVGFRDALAALGDKIL